MANKFDVGRNYFCNEGSICNKLKRHDELLHEGKIIVVITFVNCYSVNSVSAVMLYI